ncbi:MAG TPA: DUF5686 and carboxypeptidase regulatory-like domain-containing protein [Bacteroidia bacterium]|nr:DUF5686 and carboxypeptidase regulatory-like domain-containing protein [Bacteroidia bacterium]
MRAFLLILFSALVVSLHAGVVKGTVRDTTGQPVPFVAVVVKNSTYGVNTNLNGGYFLELKPGTYTLVFSQLGYEPQEHVVVISDEKTIVLDVTMHVSSKMLDIFEVTAKGDRDKGKEIMRHVIDARADYWNKVQNYKCSTYEKSSLEKDLIDKPDDSVKVVKPAPAAKDTTSKKKGGKGKDDLDNAIAHKQLNLIEAVSTTYFRAPNSFKEDILAYHDYAEKKHYDGTGYSKNVDYGEHEIAPVQYYSENPYLLISDAQSADFNFYRNEIDAPALCSRPLLSPAAGTAFLSYRFDYFTSFVENGKTIHKIGVTPVFGSDALFSGFIFIEDSTWAIVSVNLSINPTVLLFSKDFNVIEDYKEVAPGIYLPVRCEFSYTIREGKYNIIGNTRIDRSDYVVNTTLPDKIFGDEVKHYADDAFDKDSAYWSDHRTIQLDEKEISYIHNVDSLVAYYESPEYLSSQDSAFNHLTVWSFLLNGVGHRNRAKGNEFYFDPLIAQVVPFGVGGYRHRLGGYYNHTFPNAMLMETEEQIDYGFLNHDVRGKVGVGLTYVPLHFVRTFIRVGDYYDMINNYASLESVFARSNYVRCRQFSVAQRMEIVNGLFGELTFEYSDQFPITGMKLEQWSQQVFGSLNTPADFDRYVKSEIRLELKYRFRQKYIIKDHRKIILGSKFPEIRFLYRKGLPGVFGSEVDFDYIEFSSIDELKIGRFGTSDWALLAGAFVNKKDLRLLEYKYFRGSDSFLFSDPLRSFQLLGPTLNTADAYFRLNYIHHFEGAFGSKIPLYGKLRITTAFGGGLLFIPSADFYHEEFFVGLERIFRIRKQLFRFGVFAVTADSNVTKAAITYKVGVSFYNTFTRKWSY